jgi:hypothetical protein
VGLSKSKQKTTTNNTATTAPSTYSQPYIDNAAAALKPSFDTATANNAALMPRVNASLDYFQNTMSQPLTSNPYLDGIIKNSNADISNSVSSRFSSAGRYGSGNMTGVLAKALADNENTLRYGDYTTQQGRADSAARSLLGGVGVSAALPQAAASTYADQVRALLGGYGTNTSSGTGTTTTSPNMLQMLMDNAKAAASMGAF